MSKQNKDLKKGVGISMPSELQDRVKKAAKKEGRSFSNFVCIILDNATKKNRS